MNFIFLDIDGVLNNDRTTAQSPNGFVGLSDSLLKKLKHLKKETDSVIVLTSSWKDASKEDYDYMMRKLKKFECTPLGRTYEKNGNGELRGQAISKYVKNNEITNWVILDDCLYDFKQYPEIMMHLVHTDYHEGLTDEDVELAKKILKNDNIKISELIEEQGWNYHR